MDKVLELVKWAVENGPQFITAVVAVLGAVIALCLLIPGEQPEKALQGVVAFLSKFSAKPKE